VYEREKKKIKAIGAKEEAEEATRHFMCAHIPDRREMILEFVLFSQLVL